MGSCSNAEGKEILLQIRDVLKDMDRKLCHLIEQHRTERLLWFESRKEQKDEENEENE